MQIFAKNDRGTLKARERGGKSAFDRRNTMGKTKEVTEGLGTSGYSVIHQRLSSHITYLYTILFH